MLSADHHNVCILAILTEEEVPKYSVGLWVVSWPTPPSDWLIVLMIVGSINWKPNQHGTATMDKYKHQHQIKERRLSLIHNKPISESLLECFNPGHAEYRAETEVQQH